MRSQILKVVIPVSHSAHAGAATGINKTGSEIDISTTFPLTETN